MTALRTTITALALALLTAGSALAGPPLVTDDAGTVDVGKVEIELNGSHTEDKAARHGITAKNSATDGEMKISTGLARGFGLSIGVPYTITAREKNNGVVVGDNDGFGDFSVELKYVFAEVDGVNLAIKPGVTLPTGKTGLSDEHLQYSTTMIATREFCEGTCALHANLGYEYHSYQSSAVAGRRNLWSGSVAGELKLTKGLTGVLDFGLATNPDNGSSTPPVYGLTGARYEVNDRLDINAGIKVGLTSPEADLSVLYGLVLKF
ncbi:MAG: transporter [Geobacter sp.]|nr:transporter [Geobacter sp.]